MLSYMNDENYDDGSAERVGKLWMGRIFSSAQITEFTMAPSLVPRLEKIGFQIANFTAINIAVHGSIYNRIVDGAM